MWIDSVKWPENLEPDLWIWKILKTTDTWLVMWEAGFTIIDESWKNKINPFLESEIWMWKIKNIYSDWRIVFEKWICLVNLNTSKVVPLFFDDFWIKWFKEFRDDWLLISENIVLCFDVETQEFIYNANIEKLWNISDIQKWTYFVTIVWDEWIKLINLFNVNDNETLYKDLWIWNEYEIKESIFRKDKWFIVYWSEWVAKLNSVWDVSYKLWNNIWLWKIKWITGEWNVFWDNAIAKIWVNWEFKYLITAEDLWMASIITFGSWKIIWKDNDWKWQVARVNINTWEILYRSVDLSDWTINDLNNLWIHDIDRFWSEEFIDHLISNREDIESLWDKEVILMIQPKSDHNWAFSVDNHELFMQSQDVLYYEISSDSELESVFQELMDRLPDGVPISHFILWWHGSQKSIQLSQNWADYDWSHIDMWDAEDLEKYAELFRNTKSIILKSCSTWMWWINADNILNMIATSFWKFSESIVAPKVPTNNLYEFTPDRLWSWYLYFVWPNYHTNNLARKPWNEYLEIK